MKRFHLFEFNDLERTPTFIRHSVVEALGRGLRWLGFAGLAGPSFVEFCRRSGSTTVLDLCSGTGAPVFLLAEWLRQHSAESLGITPEFILSDLFPDALQADLGDTRDQRITFATRSVDATAVPGDVAHDARTIINAFHHFKPEVAQRVLADAVRDRSPIFIYEGFPRQMRKLVSTMPAMMPALFLNPLFTRRERLMKAIFTYAVPLIPMISAWDASVSVMRIHTPAELDALIAPIDDNFVWEHHEITASLGGKACVLTGIPRERRV